MAKRNFPSLTIVDFFLIERMTQIHDGENRVMGALANNALYWYWKIAQCHKEGVDGQHSVESKCFGAFEMATVSLQMQR